MTELEFGMEGSYGSAGGGITSVVFACRLVDDGAVLQAAEVKHPHAAVLAATDEDVGALGTEPHIVDLLVVGNQLGLGGKGRDIPDGACRVYARRDDQARVYRVPIQRG